MRKYKITGKVHPHNSKLFRIQALRDFGDVKKGDLGGYIESEKNLSHEGDSWVYGYARVSGNARVHGDAWVSGNARVHGDAWVSGNARVHGDAWVYGTDQVTKTVTVMSGLPKDSITVTDNHINVGCEQHTVEHWLKHYKKIGANAGYSVSDIKTYGLFLLGIANQGKGN